MGDGFPSIYIIVGNSNFVKAEAMPPVPVIVRAIPNP
jgi:hypothetical protein